MKENERYIELLVKNYKNFPTFRMGRIETTIKDFPARLDWADTRLMVEKMGNGWRLPTTEEALYFIDLSKELEIGNFDKYGNSDRRGYWTESTSFANTDQLRTGVYIDHGRTYGYNIANPCLIRLVRDI
jgi:hypothetical protein